MTAKTPAPPPGKSLSLFGAMVIGFALFGYLVGILDGSNSDNIPTGKVAGAVRQPNAEFKPAVSYSQIGQSGMGQNADWSSQLKQIYGDQPSIFDKVIRTQEMKLAAIADRAVNRAFDGAPPVIPHSASQQSAANCVACHGQGLKLGDRIATKMSHAFMTNCTQCHVESESAVPFHGHHEHKNDFHGLTGSGPGARAMPGTPPTIPHATWLREDCMSCHGLVARAGLRTTHPYLTNCTQCHVSSTKVEPAGVGSL